MTKSEFLTYCDFNNLTLKNKIVRTIELFDGYYDTLPDKKDIDCQIKCDIDGNPCEDGKYIRTNSELAEANRQLLAQFPLFEMIAKELRENNFDKEKTYLEIVSRERENKLETILNNNYGL